MQNGVRKPISIFSVKLNNTQEKYNTIFFPGSYMQFICLYDILDFCSKAETLLFSQAINPITYVLHLNSEKYTPRDARQLDYLSWLTSDICYIKGSDIVADTLPRSTVHSG